MFSYSYWRQMFSPLSSTFSYLSCFAAFRVCFAYLPKWEMMDLVSWSLITIDQIFSTARLAKGEPSCPDGTHPAGHLMDSRGEWTMMPVCTAGPGRRRSLYIWIIDTRISARWTWWVPDLSWKLERVGSHSGRGEATWPVWSKILIEPRTTRKFRWLEFCHWEVAVRLWIDRKSTICLFQNNRDYPNLVFHTSALTVGYLKLSWMFL